MRILREGKFKSSFFDEENQIFIDVWNEATADMKLDEFREELQIQTNFIIQTGAKLLILDTTNFRYSIVPEVQEWIANHIFPQWVEIKVAKVAIMVSSELIPQLSIEQTIEEETSGTFKTFYFDKREKAIDWLLGKI
ncbi:MAG: hypothetical protein MUE81_21560 [Thermoflexibacter sp.]|jgi:hypothetical protein|nr:hypothetical protein [Thermoflexibacter sp.]